MTMSTTSLTNAFNGNDVTTEFSFPYTFLEDSDLIVTLTDALGVNTIQTLTTDYTVTGAGVDGGGAVTMIVTPATGESLFIRRTVSLTQEVDYITGDSFPAETHERALDKLTMVAQQQSEAIGRAFKLSDTYSGSASLELPSPEALQLVRWNAAGDAFENTPNLADGIAASEAAASDSATAASGFADNASGFATASSNSAAAASGFADAASDSILNNLTPTDGTILVADGTTWVAESGATARASLGALVNPAITTITGTATFTNSTNNVNMTSIGAIGLEVGDVIQVTGTVNNNKLFTVESIPQTYDVIVNEAHAGGTTTKSLVDETADAVVTLIAKWYNAAAGLGQGWVTAITRSSDVAYTNNTGRSVFVIVSFNAANAGDDRVEVDGWRITESRAADGEDFPQSFTAPPGSTYAAFTSNSIKRWAELR